MSEAQRQQRLLAALADGALDAPHALGLRQRDARAARGLAAYRANSDASAARALGTAYPTVRQLVGDDDFAQLARAHWRARPPPCGDLGEWGEDFGDALAADARLAAWPYLADCARLDWALHRAERAADADVDAASMGRLADTDPARLTLVLAPGVAALVSPWPVATIHAAHRDGSEAAFAGAAEAIAAGRAEAVVVSRRGWKAVVQPVDPATARWTARLREEAPDLASALADAPGVDFAAWLALALAHGWLQGIRVRSD